ncbi:hypothetical protein F5887DRAFT_932183 [Amanita rubescens]|nr:hypothetical protein F5887DRAFT_932183 [Amanita rubescens]
MDLVNVGPVNPSHVVSRPSSIRNVMIQKRETVKSINDEIAQLVQKKSRLESDLDSLGATLGPYNHNALPNEILSLIFILVAQMFGPVFFPIFKTKFPPQLAIMHVCSHWRKVALRTSELWSNTSLDLKVESAMDQGLDLLRLHERWLLRAGKFPVTLSVHFSEPSCYGGIADVLRVMLFPLQVKRLHLDLKYGKFVELPETILSDSAELDLCLTFHQSDMDVNMNNPHHLITRIRSITLRGSTFDVWLDKLSPSFPWGQLRSMDISKLNIQNLQLVINILRQMPMLQALQLRIAKESQVQDPLEGVAIPSLLDFHLEVGVNRRNGQALDGILRTFTCHSLTKFTLCTAAYWTSGTCEVLGQQYNMQRLQEVQIFGHMVLPVSFVLQKAPMLRVLSVRLGAILDDQAVMGISDGTLGRCLRRLKLAIKCNVAEVLSMVETRKQTADGLIKNGCTWKEEITGLTDVEISIDEDNPRQYKERVNTLKKAGIIITFV